MKDFTDVIYEKSIELFGVKQKRQVRNNEGMISRRQREINQLKREKKLLRKRWKRAQENEKAGLAELRQSLGRRLSALMKAERFRIKKRDQRNARFQFIKDPFKYGRNLLDPPKSGTLQADKATLDEYFRSAFRDPRGDQQLEERTDLPEIPLPNFSFREGMISLLEVTQFLYRTRNRSAPGPNGVPYLVYKKCPEVLRLLHSLLVGSWERRRIESEWQRAEGIFIPKEKDSKEIHQFRPISLLNVEGKIFFAVLARRLTSYVIQNNYIDRSVQKGGVPGVPGCIEHSSVIWEALKRAKENRLSLHIVWLDFANAYGAVRHQLLWKTLRSHHVPNFVIEMLQQYFGHFKLRLSTSSCSTEWFQLEVGIAMGCSISPILFVLAMQLLLNAVGSRVEEAYVGKGILMPSVKAFMDDTTLVLNKCISMRRALDAFSGLLSWCGMSFKATKSRSLSLRRGKIDDNVTFSVAGNRIPTLREEPVKSLGRWYDDSLNDTGRCSEVLRSAFEDMKKIDAAPLQSRFKLWLLQFVLLPRLLWPLSMYEMSLPLVEKLERRMNKFTRKWLGLPPGFSSVALYSKTAKLRLPLKSLVEEFKINKIRTQLMLDNSSDQRIVEMGPLVKSGKKWVARKEIAEAEASLRWTERVGAVQQDKRGLGSTHRIWWSKASTSERTSLVIQERKKAIESQRMIKFVQLSQQGDWTTWENAVQRSLSWKDIWQYTPLRLSFLIRSVYDQLPSSSNLRRWKLKDDDSCMLCGQSETLIHVLSCCSFSLSHGRYTWRHNQVLRKLLDFVKEACKKAKTRGIQQKRKIYFLREGNLKFHRFRSTRDFECVMGAADDWSVSADLDGERKFPEAVRSSGLKPDIIVYSGLAKTMFLIELSVPWESNMESSNIFKEERYRDLACDLNAKGFRTEIFAVEVGVRGLVSSSMLKLLKALGFSNREKTRAIKEISQTAEAASFWIFANRKKKALQDAHEMV